MYTLAISQVLPVSSSHLEFPRERSFGQVWHGITEKSAPENMHTAVEIVSLGDTEPNCNIRM